MKKSMFKLIAVGLMFVTMSFVPPTAAKYVGKAGHITFFSSTSMEDISANNYKVVSTIVPESGKVVKIGPLNLEITEIDRHRIVRLRVSKVLSRGNEETN